MYEALGSVRRLGSRSPVLVAHLPVRRAPGAMLAVCGSLQEARSADHGGIPRAGPPLA
jgi:hypothetical protein